MLNTLKISFDRFFFAPTDGRSLNLFRVLYCSTLFCVHLTQLHRIESLYNNSLAVYFPTPLFDWFALGQLPLSVVRLFGILLLIALFCSTCGLFTRWALTLSWISFFIFYGTVLGFEKPEPNALSLYTYHYNNMVLVILLILSVSPGIAQWSIDAWQQHGWQWKPLQDFWGLEVAVPAWPTRLIQLTLALAYFGSGFTKLKTSGVLWADGYTLQAYFLMKHLQEGAWVGYWIAQYYWACVALSIYTFVFELSFLAVSFLSHRRTLIWLYVAAGLGFHLATAVTMHILHFLPFMCLTYFIFLDWSAFQKLTRPVHAFSEQVRGRSTLRQTTNTLRRMSIDAESSWRMQYSRYFIIGLLSALLLNIVLDIEVWPFSDYGVFRDRSHYSQVQVGQIRGVDNANNLYWLQARDLGVGFNGWYDGTNFIRFYLAHTELLTVSNVKNWQADFMQNGPRLLRTFHAHLPSPVRERFPTLQFVSRSVQKDTNGWLVPSDTVLFSTDRGRQ